MSHWAAVEINLAIVCACLTTLRPLVARLFPRLLGMTISTSALNGDGTSGQTGLPETIGSATMQAPRRHGAIHEEEREFAGLVDDEPNKSERRYELDVQPEAEAAVIKRPGRTYGNLSGR